MKTAGTEDIILKRLEENWYLLIYIQQASPICEWPDPYKSVTLPRIIHFPLSNALRVQWNTWISAVKQGSQITNLTTLKILLCLEIAKPRELL